MTIIIDDKGKKEQYVSVGKQEERGQQYVLPFQKLK